MFNPGRLVTPLEYTNQRSVCFGEHIPGVTARLREAYDYYIELPFEDGALIVRWYWRSRGGSSRFLCRTILSGSSRKDCCVSLASLSVSRHDGSFLRFSSLNASIAVPETWAELKFLNYEGMSTRYLRLRLSLRIWATQTRVQYLSSLGNILEMIAQGSSYSADQDPRAGIVLLLFSSFEMQRYRRVGGESL